MWGDLGLKKVCWSQVLYQAMPEQLLKQRQFSYCKHMFNSSVIKENMYSPSILLDILYNILAGSFLKKHQVPSIAEQACNVFSDSDISRKSIITCDKNSRKCPLQTVCVLLLQRQIFEFLSVWGNHVSRILNLF